MKYETAATFVCCGQYLVTTDAGIKHPVCPRCGRKLVRVNVPRVVVVKK